MMHSGNCSITHSWNQSRWADVRRHAKYWSKTGASPLVFRASTFGVWDPPQRPFVNEKELPAIPQTAEDITFAWEELREGCCIGTYQQVSSTYAQKRVKEG